MPPQVWIPLAVIVFFMVVGIIGDIVDPTCDGEEEYKYRHDVNAPEECGDTEGAVNEPPKEPRGSATTTDSIRYV
jgi:hypothetical protein